MTLRDEGSQDVSLAEEGKFILQAVFAPFSIIKRVVVDHKSLGKAVAVTIDRDEFVKDLRSRQATKHAPSPT